MSNSLPPISPGQWDRVKEYQDDLRRRQESTIKKEQQENFFRTSLRASKKLQALKNTSNGLAADFDKHCVLVEEKECHFGYSNKCYSPTSSTPRQSLSDLHDDTDSPKKDFAAHVGTISSIVSTEKGESNLMVVKIFKPEDDSYLGATVKNEGNRVLIGRIIQGGICEKTKSLVEGDELIEVNGRDLRGQSVNEVSDMLRRCHGDIIFIILPSPSRNLSHQNHSKDGSFSSDGSVQNVLRTKAPAPVIHHIRALFDYDPEDDYFVPCRELALKFQRGDILHVISKKDENWWQAYREDDFTSRGRDKNSVGDTNQQLAGLIPSSSFQKQVELYNREVDRKAVNDDQRGRSKGIFGCHNKKEGPTLKKKKKGVNMVTIQDEECSEEEVLTYEDVCLYLSRSGRKRPVVLIGPEGVGCLELRQKLIESDKNRYGSAVPHTTRPQKGNERDGLDFHFTSKQKFLEDSKNGMFVEYGEFQKFFYGTSVTAVQNVVQQSKTCLLTLRPESLAQLRKSDLMPYVVFIAPPALMQLKRQKEMLGMYGVKDEELKQILNEGKRMEQCYGHMFDHIIVNIEYQRSLSELKEMITKLDTEPQWVSNSWLTDKVNSFKGGQVNGRGRITSFFEEGKIPI
uniref:MAGUK p55 subfamily member 7 n=1 Tax=Rhabditophanes sp. KR3021 TaxID=114890 RepID=A0AC35THP3_9BILA